MHRTQPMPQKCALAADAEIVFAKKKFQCRKPKILAVDCIFKKCQIIKSLMMRGVTFEKTLFCVKNVVRKIQQINSEFVHSSQFSNQTATTEKKSRQQSEENRRHLMAVCPRPTINLVTKVAASEQLHRYHLRYNHIML